MQMWLLIAFYIIAPMLQNNAILNATQFQATKNL